MFDGGAATVSGLLGNSIRPWQRLCFSRSFSSALLAGVYCETHGQMKDFLRNDTGEYQFVAFTACGTVRTLLFNLTARSRPLHDMMDWIFFFFWDTTAHSDKQNSREKKKADTFPVLKQEGRSWTAPLAKCQTNRHLTALFVISPSGHTIFLMLTEGYSLQVNNWDVVLQAADTRSLRKWVVSGLGALWARMTYWISP